MRRNWLPEIVKRSDRRPFITEIDFDLKLTKQVAHQNDEYEPTFNPAIVLLIEDYLADQHYQTGFELIRWSGVGKTHAEVNQLVLVCLEKFEDTLPHPNLGKPFPEVYNLEALEPTEEWQNIFGEVRESLIKMGLDMDGGWTRVRHG